MKFCLALSLLVACSLATAFAQAVPGNGAVPQGGNAAPLYRVPAQNVIGLDLKRLAPAQKQHLQVQMQIRDLILRGQYSKKKCFEPKFKPFMEFVSGFEPIVAKEAGAWQEKAADFYAKGDNGNYASAQNCASMCLALAAICKDAKEHYSRKRSIELGNLMNAYVMYEVMLRRAGISMPQRPWLSPFEAEMAMKGGQAARQPQPPQNNRK